MDFRRLPCSWCDNGDDTSLDGSSFFDHPDYLHYEGRKRKWIFCSKHCLRKFFENFAKRLMPAD